MTTTLPNKDQDAESIKGMLRRPGQPAVTIAEMEEAIREAATESCDPDNNDAPGPSAEGPAQ